MYPCVESCSTKVNAGFYCVVLHERGHPDLGSCLRNIRLCDGMRSHMHVKSCINTHVALQDCLVFKSIISEGHKDPRTEPLVIPYPMIN